MDSPGMNAIKSIILGTSFERPARAMLKLARRCVGPPSILPDWEIRTIRDNRRMQSILRKTLRKDSNCIDVGAHVGEWLTQFLALAPRGRHFAFEPLPHLAE